MKARRQRLEEILKSYIHAFEKKQGAFFEFAVADDLMGIISFGDINYIHIADIIYDIDNKVKNGLIFNWIQDSVDSQDEHINFHSYVKGYRYNQITKG